MKVSILVPVYGVERYIAYCCESLFRQTYEDIEYIFVNDCTPDYSIEVMQGTLDRFPNRRQQVRVINNEHNMGLGATRQICIDEATGDYIMFVDSDDILEEKAVEVLLEAAMSTGADIVSSAYCELCSVEFPCASLGYPVLREHDERRSLIRKFLLHNIVKHQVWARIYRRAFVVESNIRFPEGIDNAEDYCFTSRLFLHAKYATIDNPLYYYRIGSGGSYSTMSRKNVVSTLRANAEVYRFYVANDKERTYYFALHVGLLEAIALAMRNGLSYDEAIKICEQENAKRPAVVSLCHNLLRRYNAATTIGFLYRVIKRVYRTYWT